MNRCMNVFFEGFFDLSSKPKEDGYVNARQWRGFPAVSVESRAIMVWKEAVTFGEEGIVLSGLI